jgi:hypothetical protein
MLPPSEGSWVLPFPKGQGVAPRGLERSGGPGAAILRPEGRSGAEAQGRLCSGPRVGAERRPEGGYTPARGGGKTHVPERGGGIMT